MNKLYIAVIGMYNEFTTEQIALKETGIQAKDQYEAHKIAFFKCSHIDDQIVLRIFKADTRELKYDFQKGFLP